MFWLRLSRMFSMLSHVSIPSSSSSSPPRVLSQELLAIFLALCTSSGLFLYGCTEASPPPTYNVIDFGAKATGTDDSQAFESTWRAACEDNGARGTPTFYVPEGKTFVLKPISFSGPCNSSSITVEVDGNLQAPGSLAEWGKCYKNSWLVFASVTNLIVKGSGSIDGQGSIWWNHSSQQTTKEERNTYNSDRPTALRFFRCNNLTLSGLHHLNSPRNHISIEGINGATISDLDIVAPSWSPNTDGIDISSSSYLNIHDLNIQTGDDCIAINNNTFHVNIMSVTCGPGHGISIGSLGKNKTSATVSGIHVRNCAFIGTQNGARIKTWQGGSGTVNDIIFEEIILVRTQNPIIINQFYCPGSESACETLPTSLKISGVTYNGFRGTSATRDAITFNCSSIGCTGIVMNGIDILPASAGQQVDAVCQNAEGSFTDVTSPQHICLA